ncbi:lipopolysaccharide biosynthesis protein [Amaricoccus sp.]|uniref:GumC family protein n=1 Tax=Amaricoccus sp. TaxID=1872485 RepID=UPI0026385672|nr:lipopolysaccharide biosynthesis protein [Amaricoccus sp.]HRO11763.1 lipopolysaccharide biosynthesis protein [Amaricoccus sp.]
MANLDLKYYWAVFKRRLPYFLVILALLAAIGITIASILPPVYQSSASLLAEPQQIPGELAESTAEINPFEQIQIVQQRIMTRANLYDLAQRIGLYADQPDLSVGDIVADMRDRIEFIGFQPDPTIRPGTPGAIIVGVSFSAPTPPLAAKGANELVSLILQENVRMRTDRASDTLDFFQGEVERLSAALADQSKKIADFKTANVTALPDSMDSRRAQQERGEQRLLDLQREEAGLKNQRATVVWVYERTGRAVNQALSPEEQELQNLQSQLLQQQAIYKPESPQIRVLQTRIAALQSLVAQQQAARAVPGADGQAAQPLSELDVELAPIDEQLKYIAEERMAVEKTLADLAAAQQATPQNERALADLQRELANLQTQYDNAVAALGQAQVSEKIEVLSKGQRFTLIEAPIEKNTPVSPPRLLIASAGIVGGLGAAVGFIVLWEMLNRSIRRPVELSNGLGIQPIATIPYMRTAGEQRRKQALILAILALIVIGIPFALLAIHTRYMPLDQLLGGVIG